MGSIRAARTLSNISGEKINATNIDNFFKSFKANIQDNKALTESIGNAVKAVNMKMLSNWGELDNELKDLLKEAREAQERCVGVDKKTGEPIIIREKDRRLWKDVLAEIAKISEVRLRTLGQIQQGGKHITFNFIENQYNDLKQIVLEAEDVFPGINDYIEEKMLKGGKKE
ncbi:unnamed protein product [marine sediment metagenome]|uniref:Uncharacterized protein n=1 Tax=marine sediment metagenome TaxID=412755 RepID=X0S263_9ZZZZ